MRFLGGEEMNMQEYKDRKDKLRQDIWNLVNEFNKDTGTFVVELSANIGFVESLGSGKEAVCLDCEIITDFDK